MEIEWPSPSNPAQLTRIRLVGEAIETEEQAEAVGERLARLGYALSTGYDRGLQATRGDDGLEPIATEPGV